MKKKKPKTIKNAECDSRDNTVAIAEKTGDENATPPRDEIDIQLDELAITPSVKKQRVWEVDFVRGLMILFVVWDHFMWDVHYIGTGLYNTGLFKWLYDLAGSYYSGALRQVTQPVFVTMFVFTSGVSCSFSRSNGRRAIKMVIFAFLFTAVTAAISAIIGQNLTINFNVIHVIALSVLLWTAIEWCRKYCVKNWQKNVFGVTMTAVILAVLITGACANTSPWVNESEIWFFLAQHNGSVEGFSNFTGADYLPFFPDFGWFLVGAFLGKLLYKEKKSAFPSVNPKYVAPITFCGRYSIWVYFGSQIVMYGFIYLFHCVLNWL